jgi:hypothetical protein
MRAAVMLRNLFLCRAALYNTGKRPVRQRDIKAKRGYDSDGMAAPEYRQSGRVPWLPGTLWLQDFLDWRVNELDLGAALRAYTRMTRTEFGALRGARQLAPTMWFPVVFPCPLRNSAGYRAVRAGDFALAEEKPSLMNHLSFSGESSSHAAGALLLCPCTYKKSFQTPSPNPHKWDFHSPFTKVKFSYRQSSITNASGRW